MNQTDAVLEHLVNNEGLSSMEAFKKYGVTRLSAKIFELRKKGYHINTEMRETRNRYGSRVSYGFYVLKED